MTNFKSRVPPQINQNHIVTGCQIKAYRGVGTAKWAPQKTKLTDATSLERHEDNPYFLVALDPVNNLLAVLLVHRAVVCIGCLGGALTITRGPLTLHELEAPFVENLLNET